MYYAVKTCDLRNINASTVFEGDKTFSGFIAVHFYI